MLKLVPGALVLYKGGATWFIISVWQGHCYSATAVEERGKFVLSISHSKSWTSDFLEEIIYPDENS